MTFLNRKQFFISNATLEPTPENRCSSFSLANLTRQKLQEAAWFLARVKFFDRQGNYFLFCFLFHQHNSLSFWGDMIQFSKSRRHLSLIASLLYSLSERRNLLDNSYPILPAMYWQQMRTTLCGTHFKIGYFISN